MAVFDERLKTVMKNKNVSQSELCQLTSSRSSYITVQLPPSQMLTASSPSRSSSTSALRTTLIPARLVIPQVLTVTPPPTTIFLSVQSVIMTLPPSVKSFLWIFSMDTRPYIPSFPPCIWAKIQKGGARTPFLIVKLPL